LYVFLNSVIVNITVSISGIGSLEIGLGHTCLRNSV